MRELKLLGVENLPNFERGDNIAELFLSAAASQDSLPVDGDIVLVAQKIVSKAEGSTLNLKSLEISDEARSLSEQTGRPADFCQAVVSESEKILAVKGKVIVTKHRLGFICTSAGIDKSNIDFNTDRTVTVLPRDPDASASLIRSQIMAALGIESLGVIITDTFGRADRLGSVGLAIGTSGIDPIFSQRTKDLFDQESTPQIAIVDELASAASLLQGQGGAGIPIVIARGIRFTAESEHPLNSILIDVN